MILQMIPAVIGIVKQVEDAIPGQGKGKQKLDLVLNTVNTAATASPAIVDALKGHDVPTTVTSIVNATVATMNAAKGQ